MNTLQIGLIGVGTVGTGVARILLESPEMLRRRCGRELVIRRAAVRDFAKPRDVTFPPGVLTGDVQSVIDDPEITLAVQLIGGTDRARDIMLQLLAAGKDVVTANKALLCEHGTEIFGRARELGRSVSFEAAVAGGIPIINTLATSMTGNQITSIEAILNGTSNFILTEMLSKERSYDEVLHEAQRLGYAEADPSMDVDGTDAAQKLVLLTQLAFGTKVHCRDFVRQGIEHLELADLQSARQLGYVVKLLAVARMIDGELELHVQPTLVRHDRPLAKVAGPFNMIALEGSAVGKTWYSGPGAGQMATASAVVADIVDVATGRAAITFPRLDLWREKAPLAVQPAEKISRRYFLRFNVEDRPGVLAEIAAVLGRNQISIASVMQPEAPESESEAIVPLIIMTHRTTEGCLRNADAELDRLPSLRPPRIRMPVTD